jgi:hypothetical protein
LLIGIKCAKEVAPSLYSTHGAAMVKRDGYYASGSGTLVDYLLDQTYTRGINAEEGIAAVLSMLNIAKTYVSGVGGKSTVVTLLNDGTVEQKPNWEIGEEENIAQSFSGLSGRFLTSIMRTRTSNDAEFAKSRKEFVRQVNALRKKKRQSDKWLDSFLALRDESEKGST